MEFKDRLKQARMDAKVTQKEMALAIGMADDSGYRPYESGRFVPSVAKLAIIADKLNVSADWLLGLSSDPAIHSRIPLETKNEE